MAVLFSGTNNAEQWQPRGSWVSVVSHPVACSPCHRTRCPLADHPCMTGLAPRTVFDLVGRMLEELAPAKLPAAGGLKVIAAAANEPPAIASAKMYSLRVVAADDITTDNER